MTCCIALATGEFGGFARKGSGTWQRLWPGDEFDSDQERPVRLNASDFQQTLIRAAGC
jgi:hypothetical protein